jgi:hypothetical protein
MSAQEGGKAQTPATPEGEPQQPKEEKIDLTKVVTQKPQAKKTGIEALKDTLGLSLYLQASNLYNPQSNTNDLHLFDHRANDVTFDIGQVVLLREAPVGGIGGKFKFTLGETARYIHALGLGISQNENPADTAPVDFTEFYGEYNAPIGSGFHIIFGKWVTLHGAEVIEAIDDINASRSFLFNYAVPITHTGFRTSYTIADKLTLGFCAVEGWDDFIDNNDSMTFGYSTTYAPNDKASITVNFMHGPEQTDDNSNQRFLLDVIGTLKPLKATTLSVNIDSGWEQGAALDGGLATWKGVSTIAKYEFLSWLSLAGRIEWFQDTDGARTGMAQDLKEFTITPELKWKGFVLRPEYRHDWSNKKAFDNGKNSFQDVLGLTLMYRW